MATAAAIRAARSGAASTMAQQALMATVPLAYARVLRNTQSFGSRRTAQKYGAMMLQQEITDRLKDSFYVTNGVVDQGYGFARCSDFVSWELRHLEKIRSINVRDVAPLVVFGGDSHSKMDSGFGFLKSEVGERPAVLWVDAKPELGSNATVTHLLGLEKDKLELADRGVPILRPELHLDPARLVYLGLRQTDTLEKDRLHGLGIRHVTNTGLLYNGIQSSILQASKHLKDADAVMVVLDVAVMDPSFLKGTKNEVRGGLTPEQTWDLVNEIRCLFHDRLRLVNVSNFNPWMTPSAIEEVRTIGHITETLIREKSRILLGALRR